MDNDILNNGIKRLRHFGIVEFKNWYFEPVLSMMDIEYLKCFDFYQINTLDISPEVIVGTGHSDYNHRTWIEMLGSLKRFLDIDLDETIYNIRHQSYKIKSVSKYGNDYFIEQANHRLCLSKFLGLDQVNVSVTEHILNEERYRICNKLKKHGFDARYLQGEDPYWDFSIGDMMLEIYGSQLTESFIDYYESLSLQPKDYRKYRRSNNLPTNPYQKHKIISARDFENVRMQLLAFKHNLPIYK